VGSWLTLPTAKRVHGGMADEKGGEVSEFTRRHALPEQRVVVVATAVVPDGSTHLRGVFEHTYRKYA
jgi:hypothetical protein